MDNIHEGEMISLTDDEREAYVVALEKAAFKAFKQVPGPGGRAVVAPQYAAQALMKIVATLLAYDITIPESAFEDVALEIVQGLPKRARLARALIAAGRA
jgi:hypothetical protein